MWIGLRFELNITKNAGLPSKDWSLIVSWMFYQISGEYFMNSLNVFSKLLPSKCFEFSINKINSLTKLND